METCHLISMKTEMMKEKERTNFQHVLVLLSLYTHTYTHSLFPYYPVQSRMWKSECINSELINNSTRYYVINYNYR
jgi:hypothetical protein